MDNKFGKITKFTDLIAWQEGHKLVLMIYKITDTFPKEERYGLTDQMRRAAVSITSNVAEGFSRKSSKEKMQFYTTSIGSLTELQNQIIISKDVGYLNKDAFAKISDQTVIVHKLITGLNRATKIKKYEN